MKPSIGRTVHYYEQNQGPFAAVIVGVNSRTEQSLGEGQGSVPLVDLYVFKRKMKPGDLVIEDLPENVPYGGEYVTRWEWPPREA